MQQSSLNAHVIPRDNSVYAECNNPFMQCAWFQRLEIEIKS